MTVGQALVDMMSADNGFNFVATPDQIARLDKCAEQMGLTVDDVDDLELIAAGDQDEAEEKFGEVVGYTELNVVLGQIFDGDGPSAARVE